MDFREFQKQYNDYLMHAGSGDFNWNNYDRRYQNEQQNDRKKSMKEVNFLKNFIVNNNIPGGLKDYEEFYNKCSLVDWRKAVEYAQQGNKTGVGLGDETRLTNRIMDLGTLPVRTSLGCTLVVRSPLLTQFTLESPLIQQL